jgi:ferredoxin
MSSPAPNNGRAGYGQIAQRRQYTGGVKEASVRVEVDHEACEANGICAGLVPEVFDLDDEDFLRISPAEVPSRLAEGVRHAVGSCPKMALRLAE